MGVAGVDDFDDDRAILLVLADVIGGLRRHDAHVEARILERFEEAILHRGGCPDVEHGERVFRWA